MEKFLLISVKNKNNQSSGKVYVVSEGSIGEFIAKNLTPDTVILIDSVDTFVPEPASLSEYK